MKNDKVIGKYSNIFTKRLNENNRITIPAEIIKKYNLKVGDFVTVAILEVTRVTEGGVYNMTIKDIDNESIDIEDAY